ncbi:MAG: Ribonuclease P protein component [Candidatus Anoxychlamydiales bacterium]|nr:Ribonuclease P protein component [Candidatus Anoxychlamydiales bacterium]
MEETSLKEEEESVEKDLLLKFKFPKSLKIRKKNEFKALRLSKNRLKGSFLIFDYRFNEEISNPKLGITISSKIAKAHIRNKFKRQIREIFRLNQHSLDKNIEICIRVKKKSKDLKYQDLEKDFFNLISLIKK